MLQVGKYSTLKLLRIPETGDKLLIPCDARLLSFRAADR